MLKACCHCVSVVSRITTNVIQFDDNLCNDQSNCNGNSIMIKRLITQSKMILEIQFILVG